jgi:hypothetical protein
MVDGFMRSKSDNNKFLEPHKVPEEPADKPFQTPDEVANIKPASDTLDKVMPSKNPIEPKGKTTILRKFINRWNSLSKKQKIIASSVAAIIILALATGITYALTHHHSPAPLKKATITVTVAPKPTTVPSTLTGLLVDPSVNKRPVTGIMIENSLAARPQSGLDQAGVVFEAVAEGGVTRFLGLFQDTQPSYIGPVRSARPYYVQWDLGFDAAYAHVGGSPDGLNDVKSWGVKDLDEFYNAGAYQRIASRGAPHNVYTSIAQLNALEASKGFGASEFIGFPRKADSPAKTPSVTSIDLSLSGPDYAAHYAYNPAANNYLRSEGGQPHMEISQSGQQVQIAPKVVIAIVVPESQGALDSSGAYYSEYAAIGSGAAYVFQDGTVTTGTWQKTSNTTQIKFISANSQPITLNAGQTWITVLSNASASSISYKP